MECVNATCFHNASDSFYLDCTFSCNLSCKISSFNFTNGSTFIQNGLPSTNKVLKVVVIALHIVLQMSFRFKITVCCKLNGNKVKTNISFFSQILFFLFWYLPKETMVIPARKSWVREPMVVTLWRSSCNSKWKEPLKLLFSLNAFNYASLREVCQHNIR